MVDWNWRVAARKGTRQVGHDVQPVAGEWAILITYANGECVRWLTDELERVKVSKLFEWKLGAVERIVISK